MKKTDPPSTKKKLKWSKGFLNNKGSNEVPATKLSGMLQGLSASSSKLYKILGKGKGQDSPTLVKFDFSKLEKEVKEGGNTTKLLERFQSIPIETDKELKELREKHYESNNDTNKGSRQGP
jgi:hypothetical protein